MAVKISIFVLSILFYMCECGRILGIFPNPSLSHQLVFRPLVHELAKRGHEVFVITPKPAFPKGAAPGNLTEIDIHDLGASFIKEMVSKREGNKNQSFEELKLILENTIRIMDLLFENPEVKDLLESNKKIDLILIEFYVRSALGLSHILKAPVVLVSSFGSLPYQNAMLGGPMHPLLYPLVFQQRLYNTSLTEKITSLMVHQEFENLMNSVEDLEYSVIQKHFGQGLPSFEDLHKNIQMLFVNNHPVWADNQPVSSNIQYIGGIHTSIDEPLSQEQKNYLDTSLNGVIYVSFGTNVSPSVLPTDKIHLILNVLSKMPYDILFKWDSDTFPNGFGNIKFSKWLPQSALLKHPKLKLFITQCGLQSTDEAINAGVPLIGLPIFADQHYNAEKYVHHKIGVKLDFSTLTETYFKNAIDTVISDSSYKNNILKLRGYMRELPMKSLDLAVWWSEHIIEHGGTHLQPLSAHQSWIEYYEITLILTVVMVIVIIMILTMVIIRYLCILCRRYIGV